MELYLIMLPAPPAAARQSGYKKLD